MDTQTPTGGGDGRSIDPSILTTQQLWREIAGLKELILRELQSIQKAVDVAHADLVRVPTEVTKAVSSLEKLHECKFENIDKWQLERIVNIDKRMLDATNLVTEKFSGIEKQFKERDVRVEQSAIQTKVAVDAALQAAEKAVNKQNESFAQSIAKSEAATTKNIDQQAVLIGAMTKGFDDKIDDIKERMRAYDQVMSTQMGQGQGKKDFWGYVIGAAGFIATMIMIAAYLMKIKMS